MKFIPSFLTQISKYNGQKVHLEIIQIDGTNHPMGAIGMMMMGAAQTERINKAVREYKSKSSVIEFDADMEIIIQSGEEKIIFLNNNYECNCIEIFRPDPPMVVSGIDMSLWWSYHQLGQNEFDQLSLIKNKAVIKKSIVEGDCHPIRDIIVNGISHCMQKQ